MPGCHIPEGFHTVNPYLTVDGADRLIRFLKVAFGAEEVLRMEHPPGKVGHAALRIGDSMIETADATDEWKATPCSIHIYVPDTDATYQAALKAGATTLREPADMFYGERGASVLDPVGNLWHIATLTEELTLEEVNQRVARMLEEQSEQGET